MSKRAREERLQELMSQRKKRTMTPLSKSIPMTVIHEASKASDNSANQEKSPKAPKKDKILKKKEEWFNLNSTVITKTYRGSSNPKLVLESNKRKNASFLLDPMVVLSSELSLDGNLKFVNDPKKAKYSINLSSGCPKEIEEKLKDHMNQQKCIDFLENKVKEGLEHAFYEELWTDKVNANELEDFLEGANHSWKKEGIQLRRRLTTFNGERNRPTFWEKKEKDGNYQVLDLDELPEGSVVKCEATINFWCFEDGSMYGSSLDLGEDILVLWMPPQQHSDNIFIGF